MADIKLREPTFAERAEPAEDAIASGAVDPQGANYTTFGSAKKRTEKPARPMTRLGQI